MLKAFWSDGPQHNIELECPGFQLLTCFHLQERCLALQAVLTGAFSRETKIREMHCVAVRLLTDTELFSGKCP